MMMLQFHFDQMSLKIEGNLLAHASMHQYAWILVILAQHLAFSTNRTHLGTKTHSHGKRKSLQAVLARRKKKLLVALSAESIPLLGLFTSFTWFLHHCLRACCLTAKKQTVFFAISLPIRLCGWRRRGR